MKIIRWGRNSIGRTNFTLVSCWFYGFFSGPLSAYLSPFWVKSGCYVNCRCFFICMEMPSMCCTLLSWGHQPINVAYNFCYELQTVNPSIISCFGEYGLCLFWFLEVRAQRCLRFKELPDSYEPVYTISPWLEHLCLPSPNTCFEILSTQRLVWRLNTPRSLVTKCCCVSFSAFYAEFCHRKDWAKQ